tara:strand:+ start:371 stop:478 length:108 start_codon:yes stop_codon:yes gene_type:complete
MILLLTRKVNERALRKEKEGTDAYVDGGANYDRDE